MKQISIKDIPVEDNEPVAIAVTEVAPNYIVVLINNIVYKISRPKNTTWKESYFQAGVLLMAQKVRYGSDKQYSRLDIIEQISKEPEPKQTDVRRDPSDKMRTEITETVYGKGYDTGYRTAISDLATLYKDSPSEFYKLLSPATEPENAAEEIVEDLPIEEPSEPKKIATRLYLHDKTKWDRERRKNLYDFIWNNRGVTFEEVAEKSVYAITGEAIKRQCYNMGMKSKNRIPFFPNGYDFQEESA